MPPVVEVEAGDRVVIDTFDAFDGQMGPSTTNAGAGKIDLGPVHPLTGPVFVKGAKPGDLLEVKLIDIEADPWGNYGTTCILPGFGFLRDVYADPWVAHWRIVDRYAESATDPRRAYPLRRPSGRHRPGPVEGIRERAEAREQALLERGGAVMMPDGAGAVPGGARRRSGFADRPSP